MKALPNLAETHLARAVRLIGQPEFEKTLWLMFRAVCAPDNLIILAYRTGGPPLVLYRLTDQAQVFAQLDTTYLAGAYRLDPFFDLHLRHVPVGAYRITDIAPDAFQRSRYFTEITCPASDVIRCLSRAQYACADS